MSSILSKFSLATAYLNKFFYASVLTLKPLDFNSWDRVKYELTGDNAVKYLGDAICRGGDLGVEVMLGDAVPPSAASLS